MGRTNRYIKSNAVYEITFRARNSLPFACTWYMKAIIESILSRVQRDEKVVLHAFCFEGSHAHIVCTAKDAEQCKRFYGELQKQITDAIKRFLGVEHLNIWEGRANLLQLPTLDDVIEKIAYVYANPSNDDLEDCIERYPGVSSWRAFKNSSQLSTPSISKHPWIRLPMIKKLPSRSLTPGQDIRIASQLKKAAKDSHELKICPFSWLGVFLSEPSEKDVLEVKERIEGRLREEEMKNRRRRKKEGKKVMGAAKLMRQPLLKEHTPKKKERKVFVQSIYKEIRIALIQEMKAVVTLCQKVYQKWKVGDFSIPWPPGTFPPPLPPPANALAR